MKTPVIIIGAAGRMGKTLVACSLNHEKCSLFGATEHTGSSLIGQDAGLVAGVATSSIAINADLSALLKANNEAVTIDFSSPKATLTHVSLSVSQKNPIVIGTTGFTDLEKENILKAAKEIPIVMAPNMSLGVNTLFVLTELAAKILNNGFDIEVFEAHHNLKKDAPSGTAVKLAEILAESTNRSYPKDFVFGREGIVGERSKNEIGMQVMRGGDIVGDHTVFYCGMGERVELTHRATSRSTFALGALAAAHWVSKQKPGLYDMKDVLGLKNLKLSAS